MNITLKFAFQQLERGDCKTKVGMSWSKGSI